MYYISDHTNTTELCTRIHQYLTANRAKYNAHCWMIEPTQNHSDPSQYAVSLPEEYMDILTADEQLSTLETLPEGWFPVPEDMI
jgi:hypothetical protein